MTHQDKRNRAQLCLARLAALEEVLGQQARRQRAAAGGEDVPAPVTSETRALIRTVRSILPRATARSVALPDRDAGFTELALFAGQARAALTHHATTTRLDQPASTPEESREMTRIKSLLAARLTQLQPTLETPGTPHRPAASR